MSGGEPLSPYQELPSRRQGGLDLAQGWRQRSADCWLLFSGHLAFGRSASTPSEALQALVEQIPALDARHPFLTVPLDFLEATFDIVRSRPQVDSSAQQDQPMTKHYHRKTLRIVGRRDMYIISQSLLLNLYQLQAPIGSLVSMTFEIAP